MTNKLVLELIRQFGHKASIITHWLVNRVERRAPIVNDDFVELKKNLSELDKALKEMDDAI